MSNPSPVVIHEDPAFGYWVQKDITPEMVRGKMLWITSNITRVRRALVDADRAALEARYAYESEYARAITAAERAGASSKSDAERTAARTQTVVAAKRARDEADLTVRALRDELEELYRAHMPAAQSLNRIVLAEYQAEWAAAGAGFAP